MKALVLEAYNRLEYRDAPDPAAGPGEVLIRVKACGICGSDVHGLDGSTGRRVPPLIMGHEASGVIEALGPGVSGWAVGDRVTFDSTLYCGSCPFCRAGRVNLCDNRRVLGVSCNEYRCQGAFAELVVVPQRGLFRLPAGLSFEKAALVEPLAIALHAARRAGAAPGVSGLVVGVGVIGLFAVQALKAHRCEPVLAVDVNPARLDLARRLGADAAIRADGADVVAEVRRLTGGRGADAAIEAVGLASTVRACLAAARKGGSVVLVGNLAAEVGLPLQFAVTRELSILGSCASCGEYPAALDLMARGAAQVEPILSAVAPLAEGAAWFDRLRHGEPGLLKVVLAP